MFRLDKLLKRLLSLIKHYIRVLGWFGKDTQSSINQAYQEISEEVRQRHAHKRGIDMEQFPPGKVRLYRMGYWVMLGVLALTLALFVFQGAFEREWINPYSPAGQAALQALHPNQLAVALLGATGVPPFVIGLSVLLFLAGWFFMLQGLQTAHPSYSIPFCLVLTGQIWLLSSGVASLQTWLPFLAGALHLCLCWLGYTERRNRMIQLTVSILHLMTLSITGYHILLQAPSRMSVMLGLSATQFSTILMLVAYWYLLGRDALDGSVTLGQWYGFVTLRLLGGVSLTLLTLVLLGLAAVPYLIKGVFLAPFGVAVLLGCGLLLFQWLRHRKAPGLLAVNLFLLSLLLLVIAPRAMSAYFPKGARVANLFGILSPVLLYIYTTIWSFYSSGPLFVNRANSKLPADSRLFLHMGWVLVATNCLMFFVAARDKVFAILSLQITAEAFLAVGIPFFLYLLYRSWRVVLIDKVPYFAKESHNPEPVQDVTDASQADMVDRRKTQLPGVAFVAVGVVLLLSIHAVRGLSIVNFSKVAYHTATGNLALRANQFRKAVVRYDRALEVLPKNFKPHALRAVALQYLGKNDAALVSLRAATTLEPSAIDPWLQYGALLRQKKRYNEAIKAYKHAEKLDPSDSFTYRNMALCYSYMGQHQAAMQNMRKALRIMPGTNEFGNTHYPAFGAILMRAKKYPKALEVLQKALRFKPNDHLAHFDLGLLYQKSKLRNLRKAWYHLRKSHSLRPELIAPLSQLAYLTNVMMKEYPKRKDAYLRILFKTYETSIKKSPDDPRIVSRYVESSIHHKAFKKAEKLLPLLRKRTKVKHLLHMLEARIAMRQGHYKKADTYLKALLQQRPKDFDAVYYQGQSFHMQKRYKEAEPYYTTALKQRPTYRLALQNQTIVLRNLRKYKEAIATAKRLVKAYPESQEGLFQLGLIYQIQKQPKQSLKHYGKLLELNSKHIDALRNVAVTYYSLRRYKRAIPYYQRYFRLERKPASGMFVGFADSYKKLRLYKKSNAVHRAFAKQYPKAWYPHYMLALHYQLRGKYGKARAGFVAALQRKPTHYSSLINLAMGFRFEKKFNQAEGILARIFKMKPNDKSAMMELVFHAQAQRRYRLAIQRMNKLLKLYPRSPRAWGQLSFLYTRLKNFRQAYRSSLNWLKLSPNNYYALNDVTIYEMYTLRKVKRVFGRCLRFLRARQLVRHRRYRSLLYRCIWAARKQKPPRMKLAIALYHRLLKVTRNRSIYALTELAYLYGKKDRKKQVQLLQLAAKNWPRLYMVQFYAAYMTHKYGNKRQGKRWLSRLALKFVRMTPAQYKRQVKIVRGVTLLRPSYKVMKRYYKNLFRPKRRVRPRRPASRPASRPAPRR